MMREVVAAYRGAREGARRMTTARLRQSESSLRAGTTGGLDPLDALDQVTCARLMAFRDELSDRGVAVPAIAPAEGAVRRPAGRARPSRPGATG